MHEIVDHNNSFGRDLTDRERLLLLEQNHQNLAKNQEEFKEQVLSGITSLNDKFDLYVRLERYKVIERAVFGVIGLMTTAVIVALLTLVVKGVP